VTDAKRIKRIQFPISSTAMEWADSARRIAALPAWARERIEQVQPFKQGDASAAKKGIFFGY
jgi:hypothetical protein